MVFNGTVITFHEVQNANMLSVVNIKSGGFGGEEAVPPGMCKALFGTCLLQLFFIMREQEEDLVTRIPVCYGSASVKGRQW